VIATIFYSWQTDSPGAVNKKFIREALDAAATELPKSIAVEDSPRVDSGMEGISGTPEVASIMFQKIDRCAVFVGDVSLIGEVTEKGSDASTKKIANPNVLLEMGYAAARIGWGRVICVMNEHYGCRNAQAFDVRNRRYPIDYTLSPEQMPSAARIKKGLAESLRTALAAVFKNELQMAKDTIEILDAECIALMHRCGEMPSFHIAGNPTAENPLSIKVWERPIERLLTLRLIRYDFAAEEQGLRWAYQWTYLGREVLKLLNIAKEEIQSPD